MDRYQLRRELGRGAVGSVFLAVDERLERNVAIKFLHSNKQATPQQCADEESRFIQEARAAAKLHHPGLCPVYDFGRHGDRLFLVMAYIDGVSLFSLIEQKLPRTLVWECDTIQQVALAMADAHKAKISHLDLKPENILVQREDARPIVMDFGLTGLVHTTSTNTISARAHDGAHDGAHDAGFLGSPAYMSPEQANQQVDRIGPASDIYSLGVTFYELLTGQLPIGGTLDELLAKLRDPNHVCAPVARLRREVPPAISNLIQRMLSKSIEYRPISMQAIAMELQTIAESGAFESGALESGASGAAPATGIQSAATNTPPMNVSAIDGFAQPPVLPFNHDAPTTTQPIPKVVARRRRKQKSTWRSLGLPALSVVLLIAGAWVLLAPKPEETAVGLLLGAPETLETPEIQSPSPQLPRQRILGDKASAESSLNEIQNAGSRATPPNEGPRELPSASQPPSPPMDQLSQRSRVRETPRDPIVTNHIAKAATEWSSRPELNGLPPISPQNTDPRNAARSADLTQWNVTPAETAKHWRIGKDRIQFDSRSSDQSILTSPMPMSEFDLTFTRQDSASTITNLIWLAEPGYQSTAIAALQISQSGTPIAWKCFANNRVGRSPPNPRPSQPPSQPSDDALVKSTVRIQARQDRVLVTVDDGPTSTFEYGNDADGTPVKSSGYLAIEQRVGAMNWQGMELVDRTTDREVLWVGHPFELVPLQQASFWNAKFAQPNCDPAHLLVWKQAPLPNAQSPMMLYGLESSGREVSLMTTTPLMHDYRASVYAAPVQRWLHAGPTSIWLAQGDGTAMTEMFGTADVTSLAVNTETTEAVLGTSKSELLLFGLNESLDFRRGKTLSLPATISSMRYSADDRMVFAHFRDSKLGLVIDAESGLPIRRFDDVAGLGVFGPECRSVWVPHASGHLRRWILDSPDPSLSQRGWQTPSLVKALTSPPTAPVRLNHRLPGTR